MSETATFLHKLHLISCSFYREGPGGLRGALSEHLGPFLGRVVRHVEHPGPNPSFSAGKAQKQADQLQITVHFQGETKGTLKVF